MPGGAKVSGSAVAGTAWGGVCPFPLAGRRGKPRELGLTMVIDKGMGPMHTRDLLDVCGAYVDLLKLAFGTSAFYSERALRQKIAAAVAHDVAIYPGGTFLQVAALAPRREGAPPREQLDLRHIYSIYIGAG